MWLLHTGTRQLFPFNGNIPPYAILSHRWSADECTFQDLWRTPRPDTDGYRKITRCCDHAKSEGWSYVWIDTCCIDHTNHAQVSECITSMYRWYQNAGVCYAYLGDVAATKRDPVAAAIASDWFRRGWTLQELLAPREVVFLNADWVEFGTRTSLRHQIAQLTGIRPRHLKGRPLHAGLAERMSWAANRSTTREEDIAYCLMGLFGVQIPHLYGEGGERAFLRLQHQILQQYDDDSLFAWTDTVHDGRGTQHGLLATSPAAFKGCSTVRLAYMDNKRPLFAPTGRGLRGRPLLIPAQTKNLTGPRQYLMPLNCVNAALREHLDTPPQLAVLLEQTGCDTFVRVQLIDPISQLFRPPWDYRNSFRNVIYIEQPGLSTRQQPPTRLIAPCPPPTLQPLQWELSTVTDQGFATHFPPTADTHAACAFARDASPGCSRERFLIALEYLDADAGVDVRIHEPSNVSPHQQRQLQQQQQQPQHHHPACEPGMGPPLGPDYRNTWRTFRTLASGAWLTVRLVKVARFHAVSYTVKVTYTPQPEVGRPRTRRAVTSASHASTSAALVPVRREAESRALLALPGPEEKMIVDFRAERRRRQQHRERRESSSERRREKAAKGLRIAGLIAMSVLMKRVVI